MLQLKSENEYALDLNDDTDQSTYAIHTHMYIHNMKIFDMFFSHLRVGMAHT